MFEWLLIIVCVLLIFNAGKLPAVKEKLQDLAAKGLQKVQEKKNELSQKEQNKK